MPAPINTIQPNINVGVGNVGTSGGPGVDQIVWKAGITNVRGKQYRVVFDIIQSGPDTLLCAGSSVVPTLDGAMSTSLGTNVRTFTVSHDLEPQLSFQYVSPTSIVTVVDNFQVYDATPVIMQPGYIMAAAAVTYSVSGTETRFVSPAFKLIDASMGFYAVATPQTGLNRGRVLKATQQTYTYTGSNLTLLLNKGIPASSRTFTVSTPATTLQLQRFLQAVSSTINLTVLAPIFKITSPVSPEIFSVTSTANLLFGHKLNASTASYAVTPSAVASLRGYRTIAAIKTLSVTSSATLIALRALLPTATTFTVTSTISFLINPALLANFIKYTIASNVALNKTNALQFAPEVFAYTVNTQPSKLLRTYVVLPQTTAYILAFADIVLKRDYTLSGIRQTYTLSSFATPLLSLRKMQAGVQNYFVTFVPPTNIRVFIFFSQITNYTVSSSATLALDLSGLVGQVQVTTFDTDFLTTRAVTTLRRALAISGPASKLTQTKVGRIPKKFSRLVIAKDLDRTVHVRN